VKLFEQMSRNVESLFRRYQSDTTPEERELLRHLYKGVCQDLDAALEEIRQRRMMQPPSKLLDINDEPDGTDN